MPTYILSNTDDDIFLASNAYLDESGDWKYTTDGNAMRLKLSSNDFTFSRAISGSADGVITWITIMSSSSAQTFVGSVGSGLAGLSVQIGSISEAFNVGGVFYSTVLLSVGNVGTGEDTLISHTLPASLLGNVRECLIFEFWGTIANNANAKTLRFRFGAAGVNLAFSRSMTPSVSRAWHLRVEVYRTGNATQVAFSTIVEGSVTDVQIVSTLDQTMNAAIVATLSGEAVADNDIVLLKYKLRWEPRGDG